MPFVTAADQAKIYYEISGTGEPLVLLPGLAGDHTTWHEFKTLLAQDYQIVAIDNRGAGKSTIPRNSFSIEIMAADLAAVLAELPFSAVNLLGHSMGSYIAQYFAATHPEKIKNLVLLGSRNNGSSVMRLHYEMTFELINIPVTREILIKNSMCLTFSERFLANPDLVNQYVNNMLARPFPMSIPGLIGQVNAVNNFDNKEYIKTIKTRTCVINGEEDRIVPIAQSLQLKNNLVNSELHLLPQVGHMPHLEAPEMVIDHIRAFIAR